MIDEGRGKKAPRNLGIVLIILAVVMVLIGALRSNEPKETAQAPVKKETQDRVLFESFSDRGYTWTKVTAPGRWDNLTTIEIPGNIICVSIGGNRVSCLKK